jgi:hypothetical protein
LQRLQILELDEVQAEVKTLCILTTDRWSFLIGNISKLALKLVQQEWVKLPDLVANMDEIELGSCYCELLVRYGLPCKHYLLRAYQQANLFLGLSYTHAGGSTRPLSPQLTGNLPTGMSNGLCSHLKERNSKRSHTVD